MWYAGYNFFLNLGFVAALPLAPLILALGPRYRRGFLQRLGVMPQFAGAPHERGRTIWVHAASVGEVRSALPVVREIKTRAPDRSVILSTFTATGHRVALDAAAADGVIFLPLDFRWNVRRVLRRLDPALLVILETEIWPNLLREAFRLGVPIVLLSGRLSPRAFSRYAIFGGFLRRVLSCFSAIGMQTEEDAARMIRLGADRRRVSVVGSLKFAAALPARDHRRALPFATDGKQWLVAGSTHEGEEEILLSAFAMLRGRFPRLSLLLAPRHPERFARVEQLLRQRKFTFAKRSAGASAAVLEQKDVFLLDTIGELAEFFALGEIAFVGGSLVDAGGHNMLEPARWRKPVLFGPNTANFRAVADQLIRAGAAMEVRSAGDLAENVALLLNDAERCRRMGEAAAQVAAGAADVLRRNFTLVERYL